MSDILIWGYAIPRASLTQGEIDYLAELPQILPTVEWVWEEMDQVWEKFHLDNKQPLGAQAIGEFYSHPVWLINGIFTALDSASISHRAAIAQYLAQAGAKSIADYGGGFGELAQTICQVVPGSNVSIVEPYPSRVSMARLESEPRIRFVTELSDTNYDVIVAQDVLEHVEDPIFLAYQIAKAVHKDGTIIFANCFYPVIECHLPSTFHLRYSFPHVMRALGLQYLGSVDGVPHALVFKHVGPLDFSRARRAEVLSRLIGPMFNQVRALLSRIKHVVKRL